MRSIMVLLATALAALALSLPAAADHSVTELMSVDQVADGVSNPFDFQLHAVSADGSRALFISAGSFVPDDQDGSIGRDLYLAAGEATILVSTGPADNDTGTVFHCGGVDCYPHSSDLSTILFQTSSPLVADDTDTLGDLYLWRNGTTSRLAGGPPSGPYGVSPDGQRAYLTTTAALVPKDTNAQIDVYAFSGGAYSLVSAKPDGTAGSGSFLATSVDSEHVFFQSTEALVPSDNDNNLDIYERSDGTTTRITTAPAGGETFSGISDDGSHVLYRSTAQVVPQDTDNRVDLFDASGGNTVLVSTGPNDANQCAYNHGLGQLSEDGQRAYFASAEPLVAGDTDGCAVDLYRRENGVTTLLTTGTGPVSRVAFLDEFDSGNRILINTDQQLAAADTDSALDTYELSGATATLLTPGTPNDIRYWGASSDGTSIVISSPDPLMPTDIDSATDVYESQGGNYTHLDAGMTGTEQGFLSAMVAPGGNVFMRTAQSFGSDADGGDVDIYRFRVASGAYARPKGATPFQVYLVPAYQACTSPNRMHGPSLAFGSCAPPAQSSPRLTVGTADANGAPTKSIGTVRLDTIAGDPATPADEADVQIAMTDTDIRSTSGLGDYTGELQAVLGLRITDRDGALPSGGGPAAVTSADTQLKATVPCSATGDTTVGSSCALTTSVDALVPGAVVERRRTLWALEQVRVLDGGPDGDAETADNSLFQVQGLFVP